MDVSVRPAGPDDAEGLVRAHEAAWDAALAPIAGGTLGSLAPFEQRVERARAGLADPPAGVQAWVAERDGEIVGMAICAGEELKDLYVVPEAWGTGAARALLGTALDSLGGRGVRDAHLWVVEANARARRFYEREGWTADGETRESPLGPAELRYRRAL